MTITSFYYLLFVAIGVLIYYILPKGLQWIWLLALSVIFYCCAATPYTIVYLVISTLLAWGSTNLIEKMRGRGSENRCMSLLAAVAICGNIFLWLALKGEFLVRSVWHILIAVLPQVPELPALQLSASLGMGYYTVQTIGYILDCYWETSRPQKNPLKLFLFVSFFPQLTTGPISRYDQLKTIYEKHRFQYTNLTYGAQRILWGLFKKLVLAGRVGIIVDGIWKDSSYSGLWLWVAIVLYPVQLYADFSGGMDIIIGTAELFDIKLSENFRNPFFSKTSQEFWQRWHITLGAWAKDYVLYPVLKSKAIRKLGNISKKRFGKKAGKFVSAAAGMLVLWLVMGIWHGEIKYVIGVGLWYWVVLMVGELMDPVRLKITQVLQVRTESFSWSLFRMARTYMIFAIGTVFFHADSTRDAIIFLSAAGRAFLPENRNPWVFFDGSVLNLGISHMDLNIIIISTVLLLVVAVLREKYGYARNWMEQQGIVFRWMVWIALFVFVLIYGMYGPGYDAAEFIYQGF